VLRYWNTRHSDNDKINQSQLCGGKSVPKSIPARSVFTTRIVLLVTTVLSAFIGLSSFKCFKLVQYSNISGDTEIFFDATHIRLLFKKSHKLVFAKAPDWATNEYNISAKKYCTIPAGKFNNTVTTTRHMLSETTFSDVVMQKSTPHSYGKFMEMLHTTGADHEARAKKLYKTRDVTGDYPTSMKVGGLITENCATEEIKLLTRIYALPVIAEIPLEASSIGLDLKSHVYLSTESLEEIPVAISTFAEPTNFKKVASEAKVNEDTEFNENFLDFMNNESRKRN
jgi:hypothetical protein